MAPATIDDNDDDKDCASSQIIKEKIIHDDDEQDNCSSQIKQEESSQDGYESEYGDSDCSITSGVDCCLHERPYMDRPAVDLTILQTDESANTTWTDEKHSSYLDSMEATFVQKMYDKEYCSLDVCGHSSHSSVTLEQECVESPPFCLNMRKPYEQRVAGLLTFRAPARPLSLVPSMWASPWIQHFKSQKRSGPSKIVSSKNAEFQDEAVSTKEVNETSVNHTYSSLNEVSPQSSHGSRKRGTLISFSDCKYSNSRGYRLTSLSKIAGEYKKQKSQHSTLSDMDILMEQQYNSEQHTNLGTDIGIEDGKEESEKNLANHCECSEVIKFCDKVVSEEIRAMKEKQDLVGISLQKSDQVVPSFQNVEGEEACGKSILSDPDGGEEGVLCTDSTEAGNLTTQSCSKTWTWGIEGPRYHLIGKKATLPSQI